MSGSPDLVTFQFWDLLPSQVNCSQLISLLQVNRETKTDCALAELYTKSTAVEQMLQEQKKADVFTKLYTRMNEVSNS